MTHICNTFNDFANKIEKLYTIEVHTYGGEVEVVEVYAKSVENAQIEAADIVGEVDYMVILFASIA